MWCVLALMRCERRNLSINVFAASACSPLHYLRSYIMNLKIVDKHSSLYPRVRGILLRLPVDDSHKISVAYGDRDVLVVRRLLRESLRSCLFGWNSMLALRLRFAFASYYQVEASVASACLLGLTHTTQRSLLDQDMQVQHTQAVQLLHNELTRRFLRTLLRHLRPAIKWLSSQFYPP